jgi:hypothetical protein
MDNLKENKSIKYIWRDKKFARDGISSINQTNINNNINITNYYPSPTPSQEFCSQETFTFIDENGSKPNLINYPLKFAAHKSNNINDTSPLQNNNDKKYHQCQSPYMKKILPSTKRQKSEDGTRIINIYKNSYLKSSVKKSIKNNFYKDDISLKNENLKSCNKMNVQKNYYLDLSSDDINNKFKSNRNYNHNTRLVYNNSDLSKIKFINNKSQNIPNFNMNNKTMLSYDKNVKDSLVNIFENPIHISIANKDPLYKITTYNKNSLLAYNFNSPKYNKSHKNLGIKYKRGIKMIKKLDEYILLIQSVVRGHLLRIKLAQYLALYDRIKNAISSINYLILERMRFILYFLFNYNINKTLSKYCVNSYLTPTSNISFEFKNLNIKNNSIITNESLNINNNIIYHDKSKERNKFQLKINEVSEIQKELNNKKIDLAVAEKKIKELSIENKKIQNINNIIVRDNKQLALRLKNFENSRYNRLEVRNQNFSYLISINNKNNINEIKLKINNLLKKIISKKAILTKAIMYKFFYKFYLKCKLFQNQNQIDEINKNKKTNLVIENNNFFIKKNFNEEKIIIKKDDYNNNNNNNILVTDKEKRNQKLKLIIKRKDLNLYIYKNIFEKWLLRSLVFKNKDLIKEKKKKKKEKFKQRKQKKLYGTFVEKNNKKLNDDDNDNSLDYSDDFELEQKCNKSNSSKKNDDNDKK